MEIPPKTLTHPAISELAVLMAASRNPGEAASFL